MEKGISWCLFLLIGVWLRVRAVVCVRPPCVPFRCHKLHQWRQWTVRYVRIFCLASCLMLLITHSISFPISQMTESNAECVAANVKRAREERAALLLHSDEQQLKINAYFPFLFKWCVLISVYYYIRGYRVDMCQLEKGKKMLLAVSVLLSIHNMRSALFT